MPASSSLPASDRWTSHAREASTAIASRPETGKSRGARVLIVEDDVQVLKLLANALTARGHRVSSALSASAGLALASTAAPDLVLLDLKLPDMSGLALLRVLHLRGVFCRVVVLSGFLTEEAQDDALALGVVRTIAKPIRPTDVARIVDSALDLPFRVDLARSSPDVAHRWAALVLHACEGDADVRTIQEWAHRAAVSPGTLREVCRILRIPPHDARDLARLLNAVLRAHQHETTIESMLDVSDRRTLDRLIAGAGLRGDPAPPSVTAFLERQQWIRRENAGLEALRAIFTTELHESDGTRR